MSSLGEEGERALGKFTQQEKEAQQTEITGKEPPGLLNSKVKILGYISDHAAPLRSPHQWLLLSYLGKPRQPEPGPTPDSGLSSPSQHTSHTYGLLSPKYLNSLPLWKPLCFLIPLPGHSSKDPGSVYLVAQMHTVLSQSIALNCPDTHNCEILTVICLPPHGPSPYSQVDSGQGTWDLVFHSVLTVHSTKWGLKKKTL